jgi:CDP-diacylglycerol--glycerol-3-phosphate 3-phosphatidyltransferase
MFLRSLPNLLTSIRLAAVPVFIWLMIRAEGASLAAGLVFLAAACTDFFDGFLARRLRVMSQFGKIVDPLADRLLVNSAVLLCVYDSTWFGNDGRLLGVEFLVVVGRDLLAAWGYLRVRSFTIPDVTRLGKWGMALMMAGLTWLLLLPEETWPLWPFEVGLLISIVVLGQYVRRYGWVLTTPRHDAEHVHDEPDPEARVEVSPDARVD